LWFACSSAAPSLLRFVTVSRASGTARCSHWIGAVTTELSSPSPISLR